MRKKEAAKCVPLELVYSLRELAKRLWGEKNPAAVPLGAILEEFEEEISALEKFFEDYEAGYAARLERTEKEHEEKVSELESRVSELKSKLAEMAAENGESRKRESALYDELRKKDSGLVEAKSACAKIEGELNEKYVVKMRELYNKLDEKDRELFLAGEEKKRELTLLARHLESARLEGEKKLEAEKKALDARRRALEEEFAVRKSELIKAFERAGAELRSREKLLSYHESALKKKERRQE
jgi:hypothetical protein